MCGNYKPHVQLLFRIYNDFLSYHSDMKTFSNRIDLGLASLGLGNNQKFTPQLKQIPSAYIKACPRSITGSSFKTVKIHYTFVVHIYL